MHDIVRWSAIGVFEMIYLKKWLLMKNQHCFLDSKDILYKCIEFLLHWTNMSSSKGQIYTLKTKHFISKPKGSGYC